MRFSFVVLLLVVFSSMAAFADSLGPTVSFNLIAGPPTQFQFTVQDTDSGLASLVVTMSDNADTPVPPFTVGTKDPLVIVATKIDQSQFSKIEFLATDLAGNTTDYFYTDAPGVPEPGSIALIGSGLIGVATRLRRKLRR
jgi:PEP-CTERM motif